MLTDRFRPALTAAAPFAAISAVGLAAFAPFAVPDLYSDAWTNLPWLYAFNPPLTASPHGRLLQTVYARLVAALFGLDLRLLMWLNILYLILGAALFYLLLRRFFGGLSGLCLAGALVYLVYPADYTRLWLANPDLNLILLLTLVYAWALARYAQRNAQKGRAAWLAASLPLLALPLFSYEIQFGLALAWSLLLALISRQESRTRRLWLLTPWLVGAAFSVWRVWGQGWAGIHDNYISDRLTLHLPELAERWLEGLRLLLWAWIDPARQWVRLGSTNRFIAGLLAAIAGLAAAGWLVFRPAKGAGGRFAPGEQRAWLKRLGWGLLAGLGLATAGFVPVIFSYTPNLGNTLSRVNKAALPGAALAVVCLLGWAAVRLAASRRQAQAMTLLAVLPLVLIGTAVQIAVNRGTNAAWQQQKAAWQALFAAIPGLQEDTLLVIVFPKAPPLAFGERLPIAENWDVQAALQVLYHNPRLWGNVYFPDHPNDLPRLHPGGIEAWGGFYPYERAVFVHYDPTTRQARLMEDLEAELGLASAPAGYAPRSRLLPACPPGCDRYRFLVED